MTRPGHQSDIPSAARESWITEADRSRWQRTAVAELTAILGAHPDLPVIMWTITPGGSISRQVTGTRDPGGAAAVFNGWRQALALDHLRAVPSNDETVTYLSARASRGTVRVSLSATVPAPDLSGGRRPSPQADLTRRPPDLAGTSTTARVGDLADGIALVPCPLLDVWPPVPEGPAAR